MSLIQLKLDQMRGEIPPIKPIAGCFIAGGAVRRWFSGGEKLSDIDVFAPSDSHLKSFLASCEKSQLIDSNKNADTYDMGGVKVQLIKFFHPTVDALLENFDFNVCQFAWTETGIFSTQDAIIGVLRGHLSVVKISKEFAVDSLRRAFKYQSKGFYPCAGTLRDIALALNPLTPEEVQAQIEMSPKGGKRIIHFD